MGVILVFHDVSEKRSDEIKLAEAEWRSRTALEVGSAGSWVWEILADRVTGDAMLAKTFGVPLDKCISGEPIASFISAVHEEDRAALEAAVQDAVKTGEPFECEYRVTGEDGVERWVQARGKLETSAAGRPKKILGFLIDLSQRKKAEQALTESNERFRLLTELVAMQVWTATPMALWITPTSNVRNIFKPI
ncbi:MAG: PAS domain-containing protein [Limisphaerales bacterium]